MPKSWSGFHPAASAEPDRLTWVITILAIDPGGTTGYAYAGLTGETDGRFGEFSFLTQWQHKSDESALYGLLESLSPGFLIGESFEYRARSTDRVILTSRNLLGVSHLWSEVHNRPFYQQSASEGKGFFTDDKLRKGGFYPVGKVHARDATRHLLYFLAFKQGAQHITQAFRHRLITGEETCQM